MKIGSRRCIKNNYDSSIRHEESYSRVALALAKTWRVETAEERGLGTALGGRGGKNRVVKRTTRAASFSERVFSADSLSQLRCRIGSMHAHERMQVPPMHDTADARGFIAL